MRRVLLQAAPTVAIHLLGGRDASRERIEFEPSEYTTLVHLYKLPRLDDALHVLQQPESANEQLVTSEVHNDLIGRLKAGEAVAVAEKVVLST
eukprot:3514763-Prymnesium_polylepis.1